MKFLVGGLALVALVWAAGVEAAQHEGIDAVRGRGYLRVCADPSNLPYSSNDPATPGFEVELAALIAREVGVTPRLEWHATYVRALKPLRDGVCEMFMGLPQDRRFREGNPWIAVSRPYYTMVHGLVSRSEAGPLSVAELKGKRVAVELASIAEFHVAYKDVERGLYKTQQQAVAAVSNGSAVAAMVWFPVAGWMARDRPELRVAPVTDEGLTFPIGAGVRRRDPGLAAAVDAAIEKLLASGQVAAILAKYHAVPATRGARRLVTDVVLAQERDPIDAGRSLFSTACSRCHGADGVGGGTGGAVPKLRNYDGGWDKFYRVVWNGRKNTPMAAFKGILTPDEVHHIYDYLTSIKTQ
jgi:polar amino acid transport system substrate-binding protein